MARRKPTAAPARKEPGPSAAPEPLPRPVALDRGDWAAGAIVAALAAILYGVTAARDLVLGDTPELMTAAATLGVAHPPGYPLFTMLGHLFSLLPFGAVPFRLNLLAVVCGIGTVLMVYLTALRVSGSRAASACAALVLGSTPLFWSWSLVYEVFSLNNLLASAMIYLLAIWHDWPERTGFLAAATLVSGLALANHQTIVLLGPAVVFLLWRRRRVLLARPRALAASAAAFLAGLLPYLYLPWAAARNPVWNWGDPSSFANFLAVIMRQHYGSGHLTSEVNYQGGSPIDRLLALGASFGVLAGLLLLLGAVQAWRQRRWYFWFSMLAFGFAGPFFVAYADMNLALPLLRTILERFYLLAQVVLAPLIAFGCSSRPSGWPRGSRASGRTPVRWPLLRSSSPRSASPSPTMRRSTKAGITPPAGSPRTFWPRSSRIPSCSPTATRSSCRWPTCCMWSTTARMSPCW